MTACHLTPHPRRVEAAISNVHAADRAKTARAVPRTARHEAEKVWLKEARAKLFDNIKHDQRANVLMETTMDEPARTDKVIATKAA